jgi:hypothetical protein
MGASRRRGGLVHPEAVVRTLLEEALRPICD